MQREKAEATVIAKRRRKAKRGNLPTDFVRPVECENASCSIPQRQLRPQFFELWNHDNFATVSFFQSTLVEEHLGLDRDRALGYISADDSLIDQGRCAAEIKHGLHVTGFAMHEYSAA